MKRLLLPFAIVCFLSVLAGQYFPPSSATTATNRGFDWTITPVVDADFSWVNQGSSTITDSNGVAFLNVAASASESIVGRVKTAPATPYTITVAFQAVLRSLNFANVGLMFRESSSGKIATVSWTNGYGLAAYKWTNPTTFSAAYISSQVYVLSGVLWFRIADNGTNRICSISSDGYNFTAFHTIGRTDFLTADQVGFYGDSGNSTAVQMTLFSWIQA